MNPTGQPTPGLPMPSAPSSAAKDAVNLPSLFIMILAGLGMAFFLANLLAEVTGASQQMSQQLTKELMRSIDQMPADQQKLLRGLLSMSNDGSRVGAVLWSLFLIAMAGFTFWGGWQMRQLKNWGVALAAAILVMVPCSDYCCCCFGIPVGIWALVMLTKPEVKSAFS
jgi:hypothetical protein